MQPTRSQEARVYRSVRRACYSGLDSVSLRSEVAAQITSFIPSDSRTLATTDPETGLFTHAVAASLPPSLTRAWQSYVYPLLVAGEIIDLARSGMVVTRSPSSAVMDLIRHEGFRHEMRVVLAERSGLWGFCCLLRESRPGSFSDRELAFMRRIAPHLTAGLRSAALLERCSPAEAAGESATSSGAEPDRDPGDGSGVLVLDGARHIILQNAAASHHLKDLEDVGRDPGVVPYAISSAVVQLHARHAGAASDDEPLESELRARGRSGRWLTIRASLSEPDASGQTRTIVLIEPAQRGEIAGILTRLYGLSPRERQVLALAAQGETNKRIAARLGLSPYTVQEHLGNACEKVGVRSRKALLAKLFFDGYASALESE